MIRIDPLDLLVSPPPRLLTVTHTGLGAGSVYSNPSGFTCAEGVCAAEVEYGTLVYLFATPSGISRFGSWSGCDAVETDGSCKITMTTDKSITASYNLAPKAMIGSTAFISLAAAYNSISSAAATTIMLLEDTLSVGVSSINRSLILQGGLQG